MPPQKDTVAPGSEAKGAARPGGFANRMGALCVLLTVLACAAAAAFLLSKAIYDVTYTGNVEHAKEAGLVFFGMFLGAVHSKMGWIWALPVAFAAQVRKRRTQTTGTPPREFTTRTARTVGLLDLDLNGHQNNVRYFESVQSPLFSKWRQIRI